MAVPIIEDYVETTSGGSEVTQLELTAPSGITKNELLVLLCGNDALNATSPIYDTIEDWTLLDTDGGDTTDAHYAVYYKIADGSETNVTVTWDVGEPSEAYGWYLRISGVNINNPINVTGTSYIGVGAPATHDITGITTTVNNCLTLFIFVFDGADGPTFGVSNTGWSLTDEANSGTGIGQASGCWGQKSQTTAGATGTVTITPAVSDGAAGLQFAIEPGGLPILRRRREMVGAF